MFLYIVLVAILCLYVFIALEKNSQKVGNCVSLKKLDREAYNYKSICNAFTFAMLFILWFLTAFRSSEIGNDTQTYINYFIKINKTGVSDKYVIEYGFQYLCLFIGLFTDNPQVFLIICATICYLGIGVYIFKYSKNIVISTILVFCLCFSIFTNTLRQDIAMVICLYAYQAMKKKKRILSLLLILVAFLFHKSALIFLVLFLSKFLKYNLKFDIFITILIAVLSISGVISSIVLRLASGYAGYFDSKYSGSGWLAVFVALLRNLVFYVFINVAYRKTLNDKKLILANFLMLLLLSSLGFVVNLFTRASEYFLLPAIVELPNACYDGKVKNKCVLISIICFVLLAYFLVSLIFRPEWNNLYPYSFYWN